MNMPSSRFALKLCALSATLTLAAGAVMAQAENKAPRDNASAPAPEASKVADAPVVRLAALIKSGGGVVRKKGVKSVNRRATGVYCIRPDDSSGINPKTAIVTVSVEFFYSRLNEVMVQWAAKGHGCGDDRIGVYTLSDRDANGIYQFSNDVGFSIVVP